MNVEYVGRNYQVDERVRSFVHDKLHKVTKFLEEPVEVRITLETEKHRQKAELHVAHRHGVLQATEENDDMFDALNLAVDKVEKQARRSKNKYIDKRRRADRGPDGHRWPVNVFEASSLEAGATPRIIESTHLQIKPMAIEEAALLLREAKNEFIVFRDATSDKISVLYRRKDSNYGLITPDI
jgi:ribosome hibernation promoting factor